MAAQDSSLATEFNIERLMQHARVIPWQADVSTWCFTYVGAQAVPILGYSIEDWYGQDFWVDHIHPEDRDWVVEFCADSSRSLSEYEFKYRFLSKDGSYIWLHDVVSVTSVDGTPTHISGFMFDVTKEQQLIEESTQSEARLQLILASTAESIYELDLLGRCTFANVACLETLGYSSEAELLGKNMHNLIHHTYPNGEPYPENECRIYKAFRVDQGTHVDDEVLWRKDGTSFPAEYWSYPIREGGALAGSVVTFLDISVRKRAEEEVNTLRNQLAHTSRVTALGELAASLAHELNQPLSAMVSNAQAATRLLTRPKADVEEALAAVADIASDGLRAGNVIRRLRALLRRDEAERVPLSMNDLILDVVDLYRSESVIENIQTKLELSPKLPRVAGDRTQLQQVLLNLLLNAGEAMRQQESKSRNITIITQTYHSSAIKVRVADSGPGLEREHLDEIFEPFFTTKPNGLGMGLSINRTIIESFGGRMWVENRPEGGAIFNFVLPAYVEEDQ